MYFRPYAFTCVRRVDCTVRLGALRHRITIASGVVELLGGGVLLGVGSGVACGGQWGCVCVFVWGLSGSN